MRWTKTAILAAGTYQFTVTGDDGIRVKVDGVEVINGWKTQAPTTYTARQALSEGQHQIVVEYFEAGGGAVAKAGYAAVAASPSACASSQWFGEYFANRTLSGSPEQSGCEDQVNHEYGNGGPIPAVNDNFSARWTQTVDMAAGDYVFTVTGDDGIRMLLDGVVIINGWRDQAPTTYTTTRAVSGGRHKIVIEYYEAYNGAVAKGSWRAA